MRTYGKKIYIGNRIPRVRRVVNNEEQIEYIIIGIFIGMMIGYIIGLVTPSIGLWI